MIIACPRCHLRYDATGYPVGGQARCRCGESFTIAAPVADAETLRCPACGAPCRPEDAACHYCGAALAVVACPACMGRVFAGAPHCHHCGGRVHTGARGDLVSPVARTCPRCPGPSPVLGARRVGETSLEECPRCGGVWVERVTLDGLLRERETMARMDGLEARPSATGDGPLSRGVGREPVVYLHCPECRAMMNRKNFANRSGIILDVCRPHGVWFDRDELGRVVRFVLEGGLEEAKRRDLEDAKQDLARRRAASTAGSAFELEPEPPGGLFGGSALLGLLADLARQLFGGPRSSP